MFVRRAGLASVVRALIRDGRGACRTDERLSTQPKCEVLSWVRQAGLASVVRDGRGAYRTKRDPLHVDWTALRGLLVPWLDIPISQSGLWYKRPYLQLGGRLVLLNHSWPNELLAHVVSTDAPVEVFQCLLGTTLTAQLKALGVLR